MTKSNNEWVLCTDAVCEVASEDSSNSGKAVKITYLGNGVGCYRRIDNGREYTFHTAQTKFRPIKTEAEKRRDEAVEEMLELDPFLPNTKTGMLSREDFCKTLYDNGFRKPKPLNDMERAALAEYHEWDIDEINPVLDHALKLMGLDL